MHVFMYVKFCNSDDVRRKPVN